MSYPETVILAVTMHGVIPTFITEDRKQTAFTFELPEGMTLKKVSAVAPGVCNIMHTIDAEEYIQYIINWVKTLKPKELLTEDIGSEVASYLKEEDYENEYIPISREIQRFKQKQSRKFSQDKDDDGKPDKELIRYLDNWDKNYKQGSYSNPAKRLRSSIKNPPRTRVLNKMYARRNDSEQFRGVWDFQIIALNVVGYPDIVREIEGRSHKGSSSVFLYDIVTFLHDKGVKNIILIDLSCSSFDSFDDEYYEIDDKTARLLQRELLSKGLHGGKKKIRRVRKTLKKRRTRKKTKGKRGTRYKR
jgi:hypothetical protein